MSEITITWRHLHRPGRETARLERDGEGWRLNGASTFSYEEGDCSLEYDIRCDEGWCTERCHVRGTVGGHAIDVTVAVDAARRWTVNDAVCPPVEGAIDIDLNFSPSTNLLPIRRLSLQPGQSASVMAAWLRFPSFALEPLSQEYRRLDERTYRYASAGGAFVRDLSVDTSGFVIAYPDFWEAETTPTG